MCIGYVICLVPSDDLFLCDIEFVSNSDNLVFDCDSPDCAYIFCDFSRASMFLSIIKSFYSDLYPEACIRNVNLSGY